MEVIEIGRLNRIPARASIAEVNKNLVVDMMAEHTESVFTGLNHFP